MNTKKIILFIEILIFVVVVIFAFFYGATYSESIQKSMPFFFGNDESLPTENNKMMQMNDSEKKNIDEKIDDFFKDNKNAEENAIPTENETTMPENEMTMPENETTMPENEMIMPENETMPVSEPTSTNEMTTPGNSLINPKNNIIQKNTEAIQKKVGTTNVEKTGKQIQESIEQGTKQESIGTIKTQKSPEKMNTSEQPILIPEKQINEDNVEEIQQIKEVDKTVPNNAEEVQIEIGDEPVKIEGLKGIESEEIDVEDLEGLQKQNETQEKTQDDIDVDSSLIEL